MKLSVGTNQNYIEIGVIINITYYYSTHKNILFGVKYCSM